ncbi:hypothetical protein TNCV_1176991 [Trichonephila clavipes]|nr:hypothetical protein TNCV_1176991 [Trichonephila clavipes]
MVSLGYQSLPPTDLGRVDEEQASSGGRPLHNDLAGFPPILRENTLGGVRSLPPLFLFHQPHERTCGSMAISSTPTPQRHYLFTNIHVFSGIQTQALRHGCQHR